MADNTKYQSPREAKRNEVQARKAQRQKAAAAALSSRIEARGWADVRVDGNRPTRAPIMAKRDW